MIHIRNLKKLTCSKCGQGFDGIDEALEHAKKCQAVPQEEKTCPSCGAQAIIREGRCSSCLSCGWSKCG